MELSEWIAVISVVIAMFSLAVQQYLSRRQHRAEARNRHFERTQNLMMKAMDDPEILEAISGGAKGNQRLRRFAQLFLNHIEMIYRSRDLFTGKHWKGTLHDLREFMTIPLLLKHWQTHKQYYAQDFVKFMELEVIQKEDEATNKATPPPTDQASMT